MCVCARVCERRQDGKRGNEKKGTSGFIQSTRTGCNGPLRWAPSSPFRQRLTIILPLPLAAKGSLGR